MRVHACRDADILKLCPGLMLCYIGGPGMGVLMLFFPDDLRDKFCDSTVRKCEKLSVCASSVNDACRARYDTVLPLTRGWTDLSCAGMRTSSIALGHHQHCASCTGASLSSVRRPSTTEGSKLPS